MDLNLIQETGALVQVGKQPTPRQCPIHAVTRAMVGTLPLRAGLVKCLLGPGHTLAGPTNLSVIGLSDRMNVHYTYLGGRQTGMRGEGG